MKLNSFFIHGKDARLLLVLPREKRAALRLVEAGLLLFFFLQLSLSLFSSLFPFSVVVTRMRRNEQPLQFYFRGFIFPRYTISTPRERN